MNANRAPEVPIDDEALGEGSVPDIVEADFIELRLPCRAYRIRYKVAELGEFSLTTEFLLRLLRVVDGMQENDVADFFSFSSEEARFVVDHVQNLGYLLRKGGRVHLTDSGHALFGPEGDPALFEVRSKQEMFDFDLISFAPADRNTPLSPFEYEFPELPISVSGAGRTSTQIGESFKRFYYELRRRRTGGTPEKHALYTVDDVQGERRYSTLVPVTISVRTESRAPEANLLNWRTGVELDDRSAIIQSCATFVRSIRTPEHDYNSANRMVAVAPDQLLRFVKGGVFDAGAFFRMTIRQAGELRIDRQTVRIVGSIWTEGNRKRFASALKYARDRSLTKPQMMIWVRPSVPYWGMTLRLVETLTAVSKAFSSSEVDSQIRAVMINERDAPKALQKVFNAIVPVFPKSGHGALELFLVPHHLAFVSVRLSETDGGYPTPLGILSFDTEIVQRVHHLVSELLDDARDASHVDWDSSGVLTEIDAALDGPTP